MSGRNSVVECQLPKLDVAGSSPVARSSKNTVICLNLFACFVYRDMLAKYQTIDEVVLMSGPVPTFLFSELL